MAGGGARHAYSVGNEWEEDMSATKEAAERGTRPPAVDEHEARQVAEAARETDWTQPSFVR